MVLNVKILGSGRAAEKHRAAFADLPSLYKMDATEAPDIVSVCTIPSMHFSQAVAAMQEGAHVIIEKPICGSLKALDFLAEHQIVTRTRVFPVFQYRFADHDFVEKDIVTRWNRPNSFFSSWYGDPKLAYGGALLTFGIHSIDLLLANNAPPSEIYCHLSHREGYEVENRAWLRMDDMMVAVEVGNVKQEGFRLGDSHTGYVKQFKDIHRAINRNKKAGVTLRQARQSLEVISAAYYSHLTMSPIPLPLKANHPYYRGWLSEPSQP